MFELFFARLFARNVDSLIRGLDRLEARLASLSQRLLQEAQSEYDQAAVLRRQAEEKESEARRAQRIADRFSALKE